MKSGLMLEAPVLVDSLSGEIFKLAGKRSGSQWHFTSLPLADYPMLLADQSVVC